MVASNVRISAAPVPPIQPVTVRNEPLIRAVRGAAVRLEQVDAHLRGRTHADVAAVVHGEMHFAVGAGDEPIAFVDAVADPGAAGAARSVEKAGVPVDQDDLARGGRGRAGRGGGLCYGGRRGEREERNQESQFGHRGGPSQDRRTGRHSTPFRRFRVGRKNNRKTYFAGRVGRLLVGSTAVYSPHQTRDTSRIGAAAAAAAGRRSTS
jgi:hypothetical protein